MDNENIHMHIKLVASAGPFHNTPLKMYKLLGALAIMKAMNAAQRALSADFRKNEIISNYNTC